MAAGKSLGTDRSGKQLQVPHKEGTRYYDLWAGLEMKPTIAKKKATLSFEIERGGYGAYSRWKTAHYLRP